MGMVNTYFFYIFSEFEVCDLYVVVVVGMGKCDRGGLFVGKENYPGTAVRTRLP